MSCLNYLGNSTHIGDIGENVAIAEFLKRGIPVSRPISQNCPYDLIIDFYGNLYKIQCKTTKNTHNDGAYMEWSITRTNGYTGIRNNYHPSEVDFFFLYCIENNYMGLIRVPSGKSHILPIRILPPKNNQAKGVRMADDYFLDNQLYKLYNDIVDNK